MTHFTVNTEHPVMIPSENVTLDGILYIPSHAKGLVIFVHGSGSSRFSVRNKHVAMLLSEANLATLLFDLFTPEEDILDSQSGELRFNIDFLATRLVNVTKWCLTELASYHLTIGYFGASTGGGAAIVAAARQHDVVKTVVSRGGRPDLAHDALIRVKAPTLLIVGGNDFTVIELNKDAMSKMTCTVDLKIIPGATHLFEEPGTLDVVAGLARAWFVRYL